MMRSTKDEILGVLKRNDGSTVDELASSLNLAPMTVRQHLTALERDVLVRAEEVRRQTGRPHYRYRLTRDGHRRISDGYDRMLALLVEQAGHLDDESARGAPERRRMDLFARAADALAERNRLERPEAPEAVAERIVRVLQAYGGFAEWQAVDGAIEIRDYACIYRETVRRDGPCVWHQTFISRMITGEAASAETPPNCADCCRYLIHTRPPGDQGDLA
jgi:predicted ArsR family transcriptional regulator